jgi:fido (protein-threonine AMPylation protein)
MVVYPTATGIIEANRIALALTKDKHPHKLRGSTQGIQSLIDDIKKSEDGDLTYQAARFMKEIVVMHPFDGANHRTSYLVAYNIYKLRHRHDDDGGSVAGYTSQESRD